MKTFCMVVATLIGLAVAGAARADDEVSFDRPGIGFGTTTLAPGAVAWEQGLPDASRDDADGVRVTRYTAGTLLRIGLAEAWELQVGADSHVREHTDDGATHVRIRGRGDASLGVKWAAPMPPGSVEIAVLATHGLRTGTRALRARTSPWDAGVTVARELADGSAIALYASYGRDDDGRGWTVSPSYGFALDERVDAYVEAGFGSGDRRGATAGGGITWRIHPRVQLDASLLRGMSARSTDWEAGFGVSVHFP